MMSNNKIQNKVQNKVQNKFQSLNMNENENEVEVEAKVPEKKQKKKFSKLEMEDKTFVSFLSKYCIYDIISRCKRSDTCMKIHLNRKDEEDAKLLSSLRFIIDNPLMVIGDEFRTKVGLRGNYKICTYYLMNGKCINECANPVPVKNGKYRIHYCKMTGQNNFSKVFIHCDFNIEPKNGGGIRATSISEQFAYYEPKPIDFSNDPPLMLPQPNVLKPQQQTGPTYKDKLFKRPPTPMPKKVEEPVVPKIDVPEGSSPAVPEGSSPAIPEGSAPAVPEGIKQLQPLPKVVQMDEDREKALVFRYEEQIAELKKEIATLKEENDRLTRRNANLNSNLAMVKATSSQKISAMKKQQEPSTDSFDD